MRWTCFIRKCKFTKNYNPYRCYVFFATLSVRDIQNIILLKFDRFGKCCTKNRDFNARTAQKVRRCYEEKRWNEVSDNLLDMCSSQLDMSAVVSPSGHENLITVSCLSAVMDPSSSCSTQCHLHLSLSSELFQLQLPLTHKKVKLLFEIVFSDVTPWSRRESVDFQWNMLPPFSG